MKMDSVLGLSAIFVLVGCASAPAPLPVEEMKAQVAATERAFAKTMADRDHAAFTRMVSEEAVFFSGPTPLRGREAVAAYWKRYYEKAAAPFSWEPKEVEVLASGTLALSSGPVHDAKGELIGSFTSVWRQEAPGVWRIVLDKGNSACEK
jgi:ketosteroid isomerase-like protein